MLDEELGSRLDQLQQAHLYRRRKILQSPQGIECVVDGKQVISFCSNDYLGLANHPELIARFKQAAEQYGVGSGAAHLVTGHTIEHHALEEELAEFVARPRALLFSTGYMANLGILSTLADRHSAIFEDKLNHASLLDAAQLSRARRERYAHNDMQALADRLQHSKATRKIVISDGVFSMDGDLAPVDQMAQLCQRHTAALVIDDAHGIGVLGEHGQGTLAHFQLNLQQVPVLMGTLGKALGTFGAFVAGSEVLIESLIQNARSYIYTTAPPAAIAAATRASLKLTREENWRREKLQQLIACFKQGAAQLGLRLMPSMTAIQPIVVGESERALQLSDALLQQGILISAIRPPTVPQGTARLRVTFSANHSEQHVAQLLDVLDKLKIANPAG